MIILRLVVQTGLLLLAMALVLLRAAGDPAWPAAWAFLVEMGMLSLAVGLWLAWRDPALLAERLGWPSQEGQDTWINTVRELSMDNSAFEMSCTPGYYNNEGRGGGEGNGSFLGDFYSPGFYEFDGLLSSGRANGELQGLELGK